MQTFGVLSLIQNIFIHDSPNSSGKGLINHHVLIARTIRTLHQTC